jgi:hypothetical protein
MHEVTVSKDGEKPALLKYMADAGLPLSKIVVLNVSRDDASGDTSGSSVSRCFLPLHLSLTIILAGQLQQQ